MTCSQCFNFLKHIRPHCFVTPVIVDEDSGVCRNFKTKEDDNGSCEEDKKTIES